MKIFKNIAAAICLFLGAVWALQGSNILGGSAMSGSGEWLTIGAMFVVFALGLFYQTNMVHDDFHNDTDRRLH